MAKHILFVDDDAKDFPTGVRRQHIESRFGLGSLIAGPHAPIENAVSQLQSKDSVVAVLTDSCNRPDFSHVGQFRRLGPHLRIGVLSGVLTEQDRTRALELGADACFEKGESYDEFLEEAGDAGGIAERRFYADLSCLLDKPEMLGRWVAYCSTGRLGDSDDDLSLLEQCEQTHDPRELFLGRVLPDSGALEVAESWFPSASLRSDAL
ncbi:MAG: response regulator [Planctomycetota bacterium]